jgi:hypothetical protein
LPGNFYKYFTGQRGWPGLFSGLSKRIEAGSAPGRGRGGQTGPRLDLGLVLLEHPLDYREGQRLRQRLEDGLAPLFAPLRLHLLLLEEENAHVQYAAIRGLQVYAVNEDFTRRYRRQVLTFYGDWQPWWS